MVSLLYTRERYWQLSWRNVLSSTQCKCRESHTINVLHHAHRSPPVDQQNSASTVETDQPEDPIVDVETTEESPNVSDEEIISTPSNPEYLLNSLEQHLLDSRKRRLEAEKKVEELSEENKRLRKELKCIGSIVKRSRLK